MKALSKKEFNEINTIIQNIGKESIRENLLYMTDSLIAFLEMHTKAQELKKEYYSNEITEKEKESVKNKFLSLSCDFPIQFLDLKTHWHYKTSKSENNLIIDMSPTIRITKDLLKKIQKYLYVGFFDECKSVIEKIDTAAEYKNEKNANTSLFNQNYLKKNTLKITKTKTGRKSRKIRKTPNEKEQEVKNNFNAKQLLKVYLAFRGVSFKTMAEHLVDSNETRRVNKKLRELQGGDFSLGVFMQCMKFLRIEKLDLQLG